MRTLKYIFAAALIVAALAIAVDAHADGYAAPPSVKSVAGRRESKKARKGSVTFAG